MPEKTSKLPKPTQRLKAFGHFLARTPLPEILFVSVFILGRYLNNIDFSYPSEIILPLVVFSIIAAVVFYGYKHFIKEVLAAHLASLALLYCFYSFEFHLVIMGPTAKSLLPKALETPFTISLVLVLLLALLYGLAGYVASKVLYGTKILSDMQPLKIMIFVLVFLFAIQAYKVVDKLWEIRHQLAYNYQTVMPKQTGVPVSKPDIFYLVFDRYGSDETLKNIYNYDNSSLTNFLKDQGFVTREDAYANYPFTMSSVSSTLSMRYHTDLGKQFGPDAYQSAFPYRSILNDPPVAKILKQNGYSYNQVSSWWDFTRVGINADNEPTKAFRFSFLGWHYFMSDLTRDIINKSVFNPWFKKGLTLGDKPVIKYDLARHPRENLDDQIAALKNIADNSSDTPQFTFAHILVPHDPYIFMPDGSEPWYDNNRTDVGVDERVKYTNQLTYINKRIKDLVGHIRRSSPDAAIIIQADEGPYPKEFRYGLSIDKHYNTKDLVLPSQKQKFGIQASYYLPGVSQTEITKNINSSVNPFRFILSHYLGYALDMLPDCQISSGNKFIVYRYTPSTRQLHGDEAAAKCAVY